jgi:S1-C subfamily serine protease
VKRIWPAPVASLLCLPIIVGFALHPQITYGQITVGLIRSVHLLRFGQETGTCFTLRVDGKPYVITAGHVVEGIKAGDKVSVYRGATRWEDFAVTPIPLRNARTDVAVLVSDGPICDARFALEPGSTAGLNMVQEVYFLGFPYGGNRSVGGRMYRLFSTLSLLGVSYPAALVKRGIISGFDDSDPQSPVIYIDALNNPGFSGAPVVFYDAKSRAPKVIGVVSGRIPEELMTPPGVRPPLLGANSGIVIAQDISGAVKAIRDYSAKN